MNQLTYKHLAAALFVAFAGAASAQQSMTVTSTGTMAPGACAMTMAGGSSFDFGTVTAATLAAHNWSVAGIPMTILPDSAGKVFSIACQSPMKVKLDIVDNNAASVIDTSRDYYFGLGTIGTRKIGLAHWFVNNFIVDGVSKPSILQSRDAGQSWTAKIPNWVHVASSLSFVDDVTQTAPSAIKDASMTVVGRMHLDSTLPITASTPFGSSMTISMTYL